MQTYMQENKKSFPTAAAGDSCVTHTHTHTHTQSDRGLQVSRSARHLIHLKVNPATGTASCHSMVRLSAAAVLCPEQGVHAPLSTPALRITYVTR